MKKEQCLQVLHCSRVTSHCKSYLLIHAYLTMYEAFEGMRKKSRADYCPIAISGDNDETSSGQHRMNWSRTFQVLNDRQYYYRSKYWDIDKIYTSDFVRLTDHNFNTDHDCHLSHEQHTAKSMHVHARLLKTCVSKLLVMTYPKSRAWTLHGMLWLKRALNNINKRLLNY